MFLLRIDSFNSTNVIRIVLSRFSILKTILSS